MSDDAVSLQLLMRSVQRNQESIDAMRDDLAVLLAIVTRLDGAVVGMVAELRIGRSQQARMDARLRAVEARQDASDPPH